MCTQTKVVGNLPEECILYSHEIQLDSLFFPLKNIESDSPHLFGFQSFDQGWKMNDLTTAEHKIDNDNHFQINRCLTHCQWVSERVTVSIFLYLCYDLLRFTVFLLCFILTKKVVPNTSDLNMQSWNSPCVDKKNVVFHFCKCLLVDQMVSL